MCFEKNLSIGATIWALVLFVSGIFLRQNIGCLYLCVNYTLDRCYSYCRNNAIVDVKVPTARGTAAVSDTFANGSAMNGTNNRQNERKKYLLNLNRVRLTSWLILE